MSYPSSPPSSSPPTSSSRRLLVVLLAVGVLVVGIGGGVLAALVGTDRGPERQSAPEQPGDSEVPSDEATGQPSDESSDTADEPEAFRDWLAPRRTLKIDRERYVSPCQVLSLDDVREIYGDLGAGSITETWLDTSARAASYPGAVVETRCSYGDLVSVELDQEESPEELAGSGLGFAAESYDDSWTQKARAYRAAFAEAGDDEEDLQAFGDGVLQAGQKFRAYDRSFDDSTLRGLEVDTVVLPVRRQAYSFQFFAGNVSVVLTVESEVDADGLRSLDALVVLDSLRRAQATIDLIREKLSDPGLSQSPAPTVPAAVDTFGTTRLLEPCAVLTRGVFEELTGLPGNRPVERSSVPVQAATDDSPWTGENGIISNSCDRQAVRERPDGSSTTARIGITIDHFRSPARVLPSLRRGGYLPLAAGDVTLTTQADLALETSSAGFGVTLYTFVVGPYKVTLDFSRLEQSGPFGELDPSDATRAEHVEAINRLTRSLKQHLKDSNRTDGR